MIRRRAPRSGSHDAFANSALRRMAPAGLMTAATPYGRAQGRGDQDEGDLSARDGSVSLLQ